MRTEHPKVHFHPLVIIFNLSLRLGMIRGRKSGFDPKLLVNVLREVRSESRPAIGTMYKQNPMQFPYVADVQLHKIRSGDVSRGRNEMCHLREPIGNNVNGIKTVQLQKFPHEIGLNPLPGSIGDGDRL